MERETLSHKQYGIEEGGGAKALPFSVSSLSSQLRNRTASKRNADKLLKFVVTYDQYQDFWLDIPKSIRFMQTEREFLFQLTTELTSFKDKDSGYPIVSNRILRRMFGIRYNDTNPFSKLLKNYSARYPSYQADIEGCFLSHVDKLTAEWKTGKARTVIDSGACAEFKLATQKLASNQTTAHSSKGITHGCDTLVSLYDGTPVDYSDYQKQLNEDFRDIFPAFSQTFMHWYNEQQPKIAQVAAISIDHELINPSALGKSARLYAHSTSQQSAVKDKQEFALCPYVGSADIKSSQPTLRGIELGLDMSNAYGTNKQFKKQVVMSSFGCSQVTLARDALSKGITQSPVALDIQRANEVKWQDIQENDNYFPVYGYPHQRLCQTKEQFRSCLAAHYQSLEADLFMTAIRQACELTGDTVLPTRWKHDGCLFVALDRSPDTLKHFMQVLQAQFKKYAAELGYEGMELEIS